MQQNKIALFRNYRHLANLFYSGTVFVAFDTETTGLKKETDFLTEIGAVKFTADGVVSTFDCLIKPPVEIPPRLVELTHITPEMVKDCPPATNAIPPFLNFIGKSVLIAHNAPFDMGFINAELERMSFPCLKNQVIDTLPLSRWAYPDFANDGQNGKGKYKLQALAERFCIEVRSAHRADDDARVCMEVFKRIIKDTLDRQKDYKAQEGLNLFKAPVTENGQQELF